MTLLEGKSILITGGSGSFGHAMTRHALAQGAQKIRIFSRDESKQDIMRGTFNNNVLDFWVGDIRDYRSLSHATRGMDYVFHAAALKQVPSCEFFPEEAVRTNILGSVNVLDAASEAGVESVVMLSTDKAVQPINAMGMTKALMEKVLQAAARGRDDSDTRVCSVRYGNVMFSRGSVIPAFIKAALEGSPMRITDPDMTRFLLPLPVAVELVETALGEGQQGDLMIRKAPAATVIDLAEAISRVLDTPLRTEIIGVRHGEKIHETLATTVELARAVETEHHWRVRMDDRDLNYDLYFSQGEIRKEVPDYTSENTRRLTVDEVCGLLLGLPETQQALRRRVGATR
ncbi:MAG: UDP-N-acetylglucosamine 4,6-dehydratase/5-epimerase [Actinomycetota bacterium]|nr:UDP-N-acetylglucosamine 4,6-dehydratase/5-epimerase [Actinomycetota bacterium]